MPVEIILCGILFPVVFILSSWIIARSGELVNRLVRISIILTGIASLPCMVVALPFVSQPRLASIHLRLLVGIPLAVLGICFRMYPLIYFKKMRTQSGFARPSKWILTLHGPAYFVTSGPHGIVRQPQLLEVCSSS